MHGEAPYVMNTYLILIFLHCYVEILVVLLDNLICWSRALKFSILGRENSQTTVLLIAKKCEKRFVSEARIIIEICILVEINFERKNKISRIS